MKCNLKNRPRPYTTRKHPTKTEVAWLEWVKGFERELRELQDKIVHQTSDKQTEGALALFVIKEILGE